VPARLQHRVLGLEADAALGECEGVLQRDLRLVANGARAVALNLLLVAQLCHLMVQALDELFLGDNLALQNARARLRGRRAAAQRGPAQVIYIYVYIYIYIYIYI